MRGDDRAERERRPPAHPVDEGVGDDRDPDRGRHHEADASRRSAAGWLAGRAARRRTPPSRAAAAGRGRGRDPGRARPRAARDQPDRQPADDQQDRVGDVDQPRDRAQRRDRDQQSEEDLAEVVHADAEGRARGGMVAGPLTGWAPPPSLPARVVPQTGTTRCQSRPERPISERPSCVLRERRRERDCRRPDVLAEEAPEFSRSRRSRRRSCGRASPRRPSRRSGPGAGGRPRRVGVERRVADRLRDVEPDEVEQRQRAHRMAGAEASCRSRPRALHAGPLHQAHGVEEVGEEEAVDDEAGAGRGPRRGLAELAHQRERALARPVASPSGKQSSTSSMRGTGLKTCRPKSARRGRCGRDSSRDRERGRGGGEVGLRRRLAELRQQVGLHVEVLDDRLDDEVAGVEVAGSVVTRSRPGSAPSTFAQAARPAPRRARRRRRCGQSTDRRRVEVALRPGRRRSCRCPPPPVACSRPLSVTARLLSRLREARCPESFACLSSVG